MPSIPPQPAEVPSSGEKRALPLPDALPGSAADLTPNQRLRRITVAASAMGVGVWAALWSGVIWGDGMDYAVIAALPALLVPSVRRWVVAHLDEIRQPTPYQRTIIALCIGVAAALLAWGQALRVGRELVVHWHDEHSYLLQAVQLAHLRLWVSPPTNWPGDFFESFHIFTDPVYCSVYWPGASLMNVPGVWLGLPSFVMPLVIYGATVAMIYLITARVVDGVAGLMAASMATVVLEYYNFTTRVMAQIPTALLGAALIWAWLRWREAEPKRRLRWVALMGFFAGWLGITRPVDGLAFALPVAAVVVGTLVIDYFRQRESPGRLTLRGGLVWPLVRTAVVGIAGTLPFLTLQIAFNQGTTGNPLLPPYVQYFERFHPGFKYASAGVIDTTDLPAPETNLPQKLHYYEKFIAPAGASSIRNTAWVELTGWRIPTLLSYSFPGRNFFGFAFVGLTVGLGLYGWLPARDRHVQVPVRLISAVIAGFLAFYIYNPLFLTHYSIALAVVTLPLAAAGVRAVEECAGARLREHLVVLVSGAMAAWFAYTVWDYPATYHASPSEVTHARLKVPRMIDGKALVLVRYTPNSNIHNEPVYNSEVVFPDEARIIWAHELGPQTIELLRYYADREPPRDVYLVIRPDWELYPMGSVRQALELYKSGAWPLPPPEVFNRQLEEAPAQTRLGLYERLPEPLPALKD